MEKERGWVLIDCTVLIKTTGILFFRDFYSVFGNA